MQQGIMSGYRESGLDLLYKITSKKPEVKKRIEDLKRVRHVNYTRSLISEYKLDPWVPVSSNIRSKTNVMFPEPSGGCFFPKDWLKEGTFSFINWFNSLINQTDVDEVIIVDPYFDERGIELIADTTSTTTRFTVLIDTKKESKDDSLEEDTTDSTSEIGEETLVDSRLERIKKLCTKQGFGSKVQIFDLVNGKKSIHDRYILTFDYEGQLKGYHLSNSIQNATKNFPLLITPIPSDLLLYISSYVNELIKDLDPIRDSSPSISSVEDKTLLDNIPNPKSFFKGLTQNEEIESLDNDQLFDHLKGIGLVTVDGFQITDEVCSHVDDFISDLLNSSDSEFSDMWKSLGEWLARVKNPEKYVKKMINSEKGEELVKKLQKFFLNALDFEFILESGSRGNATEILNSVEKNFKDILKPAEEYVEYSSKHLLGRGLYSLSWGADVLFHLNSEAVLETFSDVSNCHDDQKDLAKSAILKALMVEIVCGTSSDDKDLLKLLLSSEIPMIRALGAQIIILYSNKDEDSLKEAFETLQTLDNMENLHVLAQWAANLRRKHPDLKETIKNIFNEMIELWPAKMFEDDLKDLISCLGGPSKINWSSNTVNDLLIPLVNEKKLEIDDFTSLWFEIVFKRLEDAKSEKSFTFTETDRSFTETCGHSLAVSDKNQDSYLKRLKEFADSYMNILRTPFKRSIDHTTWNNALRCLLWIQAIINCSRTYKNERKFIDFVNELDEVWNYVSPEYIDRTDSLLEFACETKKRIKMNGL